MTAPTVKGLLGESQGSTSFFTRESKPGDQVTGEIIGTAVRQATDYKTKKPLFWDDGNPRQQVVVTLATTLRDPSIEDDDGTRSVYIKWWGGQRQALTTAVREAGDDDIRVGGRFTAVYVRDDAPAEKSLSPTKVFAYNYQPPSATAGVFPPQQPAQVPTVTAAAASSSPAASSSAIASPVAPADPHAVLAQIKGLISLGMTDAQIQAALGVSADAIAAVRSIPAA